MLSKELNWFTYILGVGGRRVVRQQGEMSQVDEEKGREEGKERREEEMMMMMMMMGENRGRREDRPTPP